MKQRALWIVIAATPLVAGCNALLGNDGVQLWSPEAGSVGAASDNASTEGMGDALPPGKDAQSSTADATDVDAGGPFAAVQDASAEGPGTSSAVPESGSDGAQGSDGATDASEGEGTPCTDACAEGATQCQTGSATVQSCVKESSGCTQWSSKNCGTHQVCSVSSAGAACACETSICMATGTACQSQQTLAVCAVDTDGCGYVSSASNCQSPESCGGNAPDAGCTLTCTSSCAQGQTACMSGGLAECTMGSDGCWAYGSPMACPTRESCTATGATSAMCSCNVDVTCAKVGTLCTSTSTLATCDQDGNGCVYEASSMPCSTSDPNGTSVCMNGACQLECDTGFTLCQGACVDLQSDDNNCGGCGLTCAPGCAGGECVVVVTTNLQEGNATLGDGFGVDSTYAYYAETDASGGYLYWMPLAGGPISTAVGSGANFEEVIGLSVNSTGVFFSIDNNPGGGSANQIRKLDVANGSSTVIDTIGSNLGGAITSDANNVYWIDISNNVLLKAPAGGGGTVTTLVSGVDSTTGGIAVDSSNVYWADYTGGAILKVPIAGGSVSTITAGNGSPKFVAVESSNVYWTAESGTLVLAVPIGGGTVTTVTSGSFAIAYAAFDSNNVYWATTTQIQAAPLSGGSPRTLYTEPSGTQGALFGVGISGNSVYWIEANQLMKVTPN